MSKITESFINQLTFKIHPEEGDNIFAYRTSSKRISYEGDRYIVTSPSQEDYPKSVWGISSNTSPFQFKQPLYGFKLKRLKVF